MDEAGAADAAASASAAAAAVPASAAVDPAAVAVAAPDVNWLVQGGWGDGAARCTCSAHRASQQQ